VRIGVKKTLIVSFPFDLFGSGGSAAGAELLADELREVLADNRRETAPTRARTYTPHVRLRELTFDTLERYRRWRELGRRAARRPLQNPGEFLVWLAGNHLGVLPVYDELARLDPQPVVVQLDAHLDVHHFADCTQELSHGNFLLHCDGPLPPVINVGHRELLLPAEHVRRTYRAAFPATALATDPAAVLDGVRSACAGAARVYLDIDCDVFDPAFFPAVSRPVPFGLSPAQVLAVVEAAWSPRLGGVFLSEFDPGRDQGDRGLAALVWLIEHFLLRRYE
jgi:arginase family enzyme